MIYEHVFCNKWSSDSMQYMMIVSETIYVHRQHFIAQMVAQNGYCDHLFSSTYLDHFVPKVCRIPHIKMSNRKRSRRLLIKEHFRFVTNIRESL